MVQKLLIAIFASGFILVALFFLVPKEELPPTLELHEPEPRIFDTALVQRGDLIEILRIRCEYSSIREEQLAFDASGLMIENIYINTGDEVQKGDVLMELEMGELDNELALCTETLENLQLQLEQTNVLMQQAYSAHEAYLATLSDQQLKTSMTAAEVVLPYTEEIRLLSDKIHIQKLSKQEIETEIEKRKLVAGFDGVVSYVRSVEKGSIVQRGVNHITISDNEQPAFISSNEDKGLFAEGDEAQLLIDEIYYTVKAISAEDETSPEDQQKYFFTVVDEDVIIPDGSYGHIEVVIKEAYDVLYLPKDAIKFLNGQTTVYYQNENGIRDFKYVTVGELIDGFYEIKDGVTQGEQIIIG